VAKYRLVDSSSTSLRSIGLRTSASEVDGDSVRSCEVGWRSLGGDDKDDSGDLGTSNICCSVVTESPDSLDVLALSTFSPLVGPGSA
jgi:hypothetical protein